MADIPQNPCPETGRKMVVFSKLLGAEGEQKTMYGVARYNDGAGRWDFLTGNFEWVANHVAEHTTQASAEDFHKRYCEKIVKEAIVPEQIDTGWRRFSFKCRHCGLVHKVGLDVGYWSDVRQYARRDCPKTGLSVLVRLWDKKTDKNNTTIKLTAPEGSIVKLPNWYCKECFASGEYIGFMKVEPCMTCFPTKKS